MVKKKIWQKSGDEQEDLVFNKGKSRSQLVPSRVKEKIIEHVAYKHLERKKRLLLWFH